MSKVVVSTSSGVWCRPRISSAYALATRSGRLEQALALGVLADRDEQLAHGGHGTVVVELSDRSLPEPTGSMVIGSGGGGVGRDTVDARVAVHVAAGAGRRDHDSTLAVVDDRSLGGRGADLLRDLHRRDVEGLRCGDPVHAGRCERRRSGSKTSAICSLSRVSFSISARTSASSTSRFSSRMSKASWCAAARNFLVSSSTIAATSSE